MTDGSSRGSGRSTTAGDAARILDLLGSGAPAVLSGTPAEVIMWTGAGISADAPTSAPVGRDLVDRVFGHAFAPDTLDTIQRAYARLRIVRTWPRLETVLDVVRRVHGLPALVDLISDLRDPPPNGIHRFAADHLGRGGRHITANFDPCIESACSGPAAAVLHFHGSFADHPDGDALGATLARIDRGLPADIALRMTESLTATPRPIVVVAGYSGSDFFDVDPYLEALAGRRGLADGVVLWIEDADQPPELLSGTQASSRRRQLGWLHEGGTEVHVLRGRTRAALSALASNWGIDAPAPAHGRRASWMPVVDVPERDRRRATLELFHVMGLHHEVKNTLRDLGGPASPDEWGIAARSAWASGRYRDAARGWQRAHGGSGTLARIRRAERSGACDWVRGRYLRAYRTLRQTLEWAAALPADEASLEMRLQVAETLGRVLVHMRRSPDTRILATARRRRWMLDQLPDPDAPGQRLGTHLTAQVRSVRVDLGATTGTDRWTSAQAAFAEYESLNAQLNYRHAELRHRAATRASVDAHAFEQLRDDFQAIGADGDAARVPLIPGAEAVFTVTDVATGLRRVDMTTWHQCRLLAAFAMRRLAHRLRARHR